MKTNKILLSMITISVLSQSIMALDIDGFNVEDIEVKKTETKKVKKEDVDNKEKLKEDVDNKENVGYSKVSLSEVRLLQDRITYLEEKLIELSEYSQKIEKIDKLEQKINKIRRENLNTKDNTEIKLMLKQELLNLNRNFDDNLRDVSDFTETNSEDITEIENEIGELKENLKYQVFKISSLEDANFDLEDKMDEKFDKQVQWHGDFTSFVGAGYGVSDLILSTKNKLRQIKTIDGKQALTNEQINKYADYYNDRNQIGSNLMGNLVVYNKLTDNLKWLFQANLTYADYIPMNNVNIEKENSDFLDRGYMEYSVNNILKLKIGKTWVKNTRYSDNKFVSERDASLSPLYEGVMVPVNTVGVEVLGSTNINNVLFDYNINLGEANKGRVPTDEKLISGRIRFELPLLDYTRVSSSMAFLPENRNNPYINDYYNKFVYSFGLEQRFKQFRWNMDFIAGHYSAQEDRDLGSYHELNDYTKKAFNGTFAYDYDDKITLWTMFDYFDQKQEYAVDILPINYVDSSLTQEQQVQVIDIPDAYTRYAFGINYNLSQNTIVKFEQYISKYKGNSSQITLNARF